MKKKIFEVTAFIGKDCKTVVYTDFATAYAHIKRLASYGFKVQFSIETRHYTNKQVLSTSKTYFFKGGHIENYVSMSHIKLAGRKLQTVQSFLHHGTI